VLIHCYQHFASQECVGEPTVCIQFVHDSAFQNSFLAESPMCSKDSIHQDRIQSSCSLFLSIVLFLLFKNNIIFEKEKHFQNNKIANQKCMNPAFDHSTHRLHLNHCDMPPDLVSLRRSFCLFLVAKNRQVNKMNKKLKNKIAFSRVEPGSNHYSSNRSEPLRHGDKPVDLFPQRFP
jgi:hypothetical protein